MFRLLIVDDEYYVRLGIKTAIDWSDIDVEVVGEATDGEEAVEMALLYRPDIILTDIRMPFMDGLILMERLRREMPECVFIVLSGYSEFEYVRQAIRQGALAYLLKPIDQRELKDTVLGVTKKLQAKKDTGEYYKALSDEYFELQQQFLQYLLQGGKLSADMIKARLDELHLPVITAPYMVTMLCRNSNEASGGGQERQVREILQKRLRDIPQKKRMVVLLPYQWCVVAEIDESAKLRKCMRWWEETALILQRETGDTYVVGISSVWRDFREVSQAYQEARHAADIKGFPGLNSVVSYQDAFSACSRREVRDAVKYIKNHFYEDITVESAAQALGISASRLMHIFKEDLGVTFNARVMESRIDMAVRLIGTKRYRIYEIAEMVGYKDIRHFSRVFKRVTGMMPGAYGKALYEEERVDIP